MAFEAVVKTEGDHRRLVINYRGAPFGADVAQYEQAMRDVVSKLQELDADEIVLTEYYDRIYNDEQTRMLKSVADWITKMETESIWSPSHLGKTAEPKTISARHDFVTALINRAYGDPFGAYLDLVREIKKENERSANLAGEQLDDLNVYIGTLRFMLTNFEETAMIKRVKQYLAQLKELPAGRGIYMSLFEVTIKPSFIGSRIFFSGVENLELVDRYQVLGSDVYIYKHPERVEYLYYINPPEYTLPPDKYFLLEKTKEIVAGQRPSNIGFMDIAQARRYFRKIYVSTIADLALKNNINLTVSEKEELATIVARYTVGYGILELLLSDRKLTDVYIDAPLGVKPIFLVHSQYGQCQSNVIYSDEEARAVVSRFRGLSGRPFDEAHPVLDFDLPDLQTRIAVIGRPLSADGIAFAFRLHKETPWTLAQFVDNKMMTPFAAGLMSYIVDAQGSTLVVGSRGSGKTSMLQALMLEAPQNLRFITQEDTLELPSPALKRIGFNIQRLKTRPPLGAVSESEPSAEDALRTALRLGDSVLVVGEVRSGEARALFEAMRVGAVGNVVLGTIHGESAYSVWDRIVNDLGVPTTSFKATDFVLVTAPIRFKGSLKRQRRVVELVEIKKHWVTDPDKEEGFLSWLDFDAGKDDQVFNKDVVAESEWLQKIRRIRGLSNEDIFAEIQLRAESKQYLVDKKRELDVPKLLEAEYSVRAHNHMLLIEERMRSEGTLDRRALMDEWKAWVDDNLVAELLKAKALAA
ncbi:MAG TPA: type II/IV secretion system ATPase subunit [Candidatus Norongarragalinales archaeon]|jgi:type IV secretory pathway ATPase VirB11/archaellum biosynthesis ATPase|nr:type II/IV secretion system ATPase subunit [Candidatus Norongarragalinales archaeon]